MTTFEGSQDGKGLRVGIVCSRFNEFIVSALLDGAQRGLASHGVSESDIDIAWVPGAYEIPVTTKAIVFERVTNVELRKAAEHVGAIVCVNSHLH